MLKLLQGADRSSLRIWYAVVTPSREAETAEVGAGQYLASSHSSFPSSALSKIPRKAATIPAAYLATNDSQLKWAFKAQKQLHFSWWREDGAFISLSGLEKPYIAEQIGEPRWRSAQTEYGARHLSHPFAGNLACPARSTWALGGNQNVGLGNSVAERDFHGCALVLQAPPAYVLGGTEFLLPGTELPQPWAACCPARTLAPLGFTHATQCLHRYIYQAKKRFWLAVVLAVRLSCAI